MEEGAKQTEDGSTKTEAAFRFSLSGLRGPSFVSRPLSSVFPLVCVVLLSQFLQGCGKKGPPLAPLDVAPAAPTGLQVRRLGDTVYLQLKVPEKSVAGTGTFSVARLEVYAATIAPESVVPAARDLLKAQYVAATISVRPPADPDAAPPEGASPDTRPKPGDTITFVEKLTAEVLTPQQVVKPASAAVSGKGRASPVSPAEAAPAPAPASPAAAAVLSRVYLVRGVAANGSKGAPSARVSVPLLAAPAAARPGPASFDASSITIKWEPPASPSDEASGVTYNVYSVPAAGSGAGGVPLSAPVPLNSTPLAETTFSHPGAAAGQEQCFVVRSVATVGTSAIESDASDPICVTPRDTFPPEAPKGLAAVSGTGVINLIWDANAEGDLGGYLVLRGEAPGDTLQPLTPEPIRETRYADRSVKPGVSYVYAIVAVDRATPPNRSAPSAKVQETAR